MNEHLTQEETNIPPLLRANFSKEEEDVIVQKIGARGGLAGLRLILPYVAVAMQEWATPEFYNDFIASLPAPLRHLLFTYHIPDMENCVIPKRDAPFLEKKPTLDRVKCCKLPFCCSCII